eukprot:SAG11_NODE_1028_length_6123_cov_1.537517_5_plen_68_part_00
MRTDFDVHSADCRVAFHGELLCKLPKRVRPDIRSGERSMLKVYKTKQRIGAIDRPQVCNVSSTSIIV